MVRKTLSTLVANADAILVELKLDGNVRPENLSPETFWLMYQAMGHQTK
jgi:16S rRNA A1518/A1519 N6-dimethyltransferase RsmA/KsgA/DIM1 with predicted DNA glycosylase/AP lyase activity